MLQNLPVPVDSNREPIKIGDRVTLNEVDKIEYPEPYWTIISIEPSNEFEKPTWNLYLESPNGREEEFWAHRVTKKEV